MHNLLVSTGLIVTVSTVWYKQANQSLDVGVGKYGIWIVKTDNSIQYLDHSDTTLQDEDNVNW